MNLPNKLTIFRVVLIPFFVFCDSDFYRGKPDRFCRRENSQKV